jgi:hypothetical protein
VIVGTAPWAARLKAWKKGGSFSATGFDAFTSGSRSSRVALRLTKVVFAWRMKSGKRTRASFSAEDWLAIAPIIKFALWMSSEMSFDRSASAPERWEVSTIRRCRVGVSLVSSPKTWREVERNGFRYLKPVFACFDTPAPS